MSTVSSELNALELDQILGSALAAVVKAQGMAASQLADFIQNVGFDPPVSGQAPKARNFSFTFNRSELDKTTGNMVQKQVTAEVPVLSILSLPSLSIDEASLDFELKIVAHDAGSPTTTATSAGSKAATTSGTMSGTMMASPALPAKLFAVPARANVVRGSAGTTTVDTTGSIKIHVVVRRQDTLGLQKVQSLLDAATGEKTT
jgi:hypothetical protein